MYALFPGLPAQYSLGTYQGWNTPQQVDKGTERDPAADAYKVASFSCAEDTGKHIANTHVQNTYLLFMKRAIDVALIVFFVALVGNLVFFSPIGIFKQTRSSPFPLRPVAEIAPCNMVSSTTTTCP